MDTASKPTRYEYDEGLRAALLVQGRKTVTLLRNQASMLEEALSAIEALTGMGEASDNAFRRLERAILTLVSQGVDDR